MNLSNKRSTKHYNCDTLQNYLLNTAWNNNTFDANTLAKTLITDISYRIEINFFINSTYVQLDIPDLPLCVIEKV